jgi:DtxR family Mn-dependent transcriptional regulator
MIAEGLLSSEGNLISLTAKGYVKAQGVVRRHRLAEVLLRNVLSVSDSSMESTACKVEHILNAEVTDAVCTFLGHPPTCPHGRKIPKGECCKTFKESVEPLIVTLEKIEIGEEASVVFIHTLRHAYLQRLSAFGLLPGCIVRMKQKNPALIIQLGQTDLALDNRAGAEIFVRRKNSKG